MDDIKLLYTSSRYQGHIAYWEETFAALNDPVRLVYGGNYRVRSKEAMGPFETSVIPMDDATKKAIQALTGNRDMETFIVLLTGLFILLSRYGRGAHAVVCSPKMKTGEHDAGQRDMVPLIMALDGKKTIRDAVMDVSAMVSKSYKYQDIPILGIAEENQVDPLRLFAEICIHHPGIHRAYPDHDEIPLGLDIVNHDGGGVKEIHMRVDTGFYPEQIRNNFIIHYANVLRAFRDVSTPVHAVIMMSDTELSSLMALYDHTRDVTWPHHASIADLFEEQAAATPDAIAVDYYGNTLSYSEVNDHANRLARYLMDQYGVGQGDVICMMMARSQWLPSVFLGILKTGAAYLPIESGAPIDRIGYMIDNADATLVISEEAFLDNTLFGVLRDRPGKTPGILKTGGRTPLSEKRIVPISDRSLVNYSRYNDSIQHAMVKECVTLQASRGCPYACAYCHKIWPKKHMFRPHHHLFEEVMLLYKAGFRKFSFVDDIFNLNTRNTSLFLQRLIDEGLSIELFFPNGLRGDLLTPDYIDLLVQAGTTSIAFALETGSPRLQKLISKHMKLDRLKENITYTIQHHPHVLTEIFLMHGFPSETEEEAAMTLEFLKSLTWVDFPYLHMLHIYPNTRMYDLAIENGISDATIRHSDGLAFHEIPDTLPFAKTFTKKYQARFLNEYFMKKERLLDRLPRQMAVMTEDELVSKYDSYFPFTIETFDDVLRCAGIRRDALANVEFRPDNRNHAIEANLKQVFKKERDPASLKTPYRVLLIDASQYFSHDSQMIDNLIEAPLGLMYLLTYLHECFQGDIQGKIIKSRIDFDCFEDLKKEIARFSPHVIGIRALSLYKHFFHKMVALIRQWGFEMPIISGGPYATSSYETVLADPGVDLVVLGEGEETFSEVVGLLMDTDPDEWGKKVTWDEDTLARIKGLAFTRTENKRKITTHPVLFYDQIQARLHTYSSENPAREVSQESPAYIMYTSGSTGQPKGCVVTHRNVVRLMKNNQFQFDFNASDTWIMAHSYSFDFSVWEMYGALLYGGTLVIPDRKDVVDPSAFYRMVRAKKVTVLNQTPQAFYNYIREDETYGDDPQVHVPRYVIFGGDRLDVARVTRWYESHKEKGGPNPSLPRLINMYGITETTVHVTYLDITGALEAGRLPSAATKSYIGTPIPGTALLICDAYMNLMPVGFPGEMMVGGSGVSKGYINLPGMTQERFFSPAFSPSWNTDIERVYKSGDLAFYDVNKSAVYLGRNDNQVSIRGYRIELNEIESAMADLPFMDRVLVTTKQNSLGYQELVAYYVASEPVETDGIRGRLQRSLPEYMVPQIMIPVDDIPLTKNGKPDMDALPDYKDASESLDASYVPPKTDIEKQMVRVWESILERKQIGVNDNYFFLGGDSIKAIRIISRLAEENIAIDLKDLFQYQTVSELAPYATIRKPEEKGEAAISGPILLSPVQAWFFHMFKDTPHHYNQSDMLFSKEGFDEGALKQALNDLIHHHDMLRAGFSVSEDRVVQEVATSIDMGPVLKTVDLTGQENWQGTLDAVVLKTQGSLTLDAPPLVRGILFKGDDGDRLFLTIHHLIVDTVSWHILGEDLMKSYGGHLTGQARHMGPRSASFQEWSAAMHRYADHHITRSQRDYWRAALDAQADPLTPDMPGDGLSCRYGDTRWATLTLDDTLTRTLMTKIHTPYRTEPVHILLAGCVFALHHVMGMSTLKFQMEGHGREPLAGVPDVSRTIGWFTSLYPLVVALPEKQDMGYRIRYIKEAMKAVPDNGVTFGLVHPAPGPIAEISFNYLGGVADRMAGDMVLATESIGGTVSPDAVRPCLIDVECMVRNRSLVLRMGYGTARFSHETITRLLDVYGATLQAICDHCLGRDVVELTPSDIDYDGLELDELDDLINTLAN